MRTHSFNFDPGEGKKWSYEAIALSLLQDIRDTLHEILERERIAAELYDKNQRLLRVIRVLQHRDIVERKFGDREVIRFSEFASGYFWDIYPDDLVSVPFLELEKAGRGYRVRLLKDRG